MPIRKCTVDESAAVGDFYDATVKFMNDNNVNYPRWLYKIFPSKKYAVDAARAGTQFVCADGGKSARRSSSPKTPKAITRQSLGRGLWLSANISYCTP